MRSQSGSNLSRLSRALSAAKDPAARNRFGGASRARTDDLIVANDALSQLSYSPKMQVGG
jgi:hypothetical protein